MHEAKMKSKTKTWMLAVGLAAAGFVAGWLTASVQNVDKLDLAQITANRWMGTLGLLVKDVRDLEPVDPDMTQAVVRRGLDIDSVTLAQLYDGMSRAQKKQLAFYIPMARAIAAQRVTIRLGIRDRHALLIFADCMQKIQSQGGSMHECFESREETGGKP